jgi:adenine-specific DNA-methyltransferase
MPFLDWVNKNQAKETAREVPYHFGAQPMVVDDVSPIGAAARVAGGRWQHNGPVP